MRFLICIFVFLGFLLASSHAQAAARGDVVINVEIKDLGKLVSTFMEDFGEAMGEMTPEEKAKLKVSVEAANQPFSLSIGGKIFIQGSSMRLAINDFLAEAFGAAPSVMVEVMVNEADNYAYMYYPDTLNGLKFNMKGMKPEQLAGSGALIGNRDYSQILKGANVRTISAREILGLMATGYAVKLPAEAGAGAELNLWVSEKYGFPIAVRMTMPGMNFTWEIHNLTEMQDRGPEFFRPPVNAKIQEADPAQMMSAAGAFGGR